VLLVNRGETTEIVESIVLEPPVVEGTGPDPPSWFNDRRETLPPGGAIKHVVPVSGLHGVGNQPGVAFIAYARTVAGLIAEWPPRGNRAGVCPTE
jgi:hypothetical protein